MNEPLHCADPRRRAAIRAHTDADGQHDLNGIDYVEVSDDQRQISVHFLGKAPQQLAPANIRIDGGRRVTGIRVTDLRLCIEDDPELDDCLTLTVDRPGDFSPYTLRLVNPDPFGRPGDTPLDGFDPRYARITFSFKAGCPSDLDCVAPPDCPPEPRAEPSINYLAKDYASFRQLILDRLALVMPGWTERHAPDLGITLVELLAYVGDQLSYYQDAVATEAYLDTARKRISVRRHARLVDYRMHDGCNARAWVCVATDSPALALPAGQYFFLAGYDDGQAALPGALSLDDLRSVPPDRYEAFEPVQAEQPVTLYEAHNRLVFYTWGDRECCLPRGATSATLKDRWAPPGQQAPDGTDAPPADSGAPSQQKASDPPKQQPPAPARTRALRLQPGDVLIFEELLGPKTGDPADADPRRRHAVRLTQAEPAVDALFDQPVVEIGWDAADALPFALCLSTLSGPPGCAYLDEVSVARGNVILVDHGRRVEEQLDPVPQALRRDQACEAEGLPHPSQTRPARFRPRLRQAPLTQRVPFPPPARIAALQAERLRGLLDRVLGRVAALLVQVRAGQALGQADLALLATLFGPSALAEAGLQPPRPRQRPTTPQDQAAAVERLLARAPELLARKTRRLAGLIARAQAGLVLNRQDGHDLDALFGAGSAEGLDPDNPALLGPASAAVLQDPLDALPAVRLSGQQLWLPQPDLLHSGPRDRHVVVETDDSGRAHLRFGDGASGRSPPAGARLTASYRVGNGAAGNVGAETITRIVFRDALPSGARLTPRNPLPAVGGTDPQPLAEVKLYAPTAFRRELRRAITADDYARLAERHPRVQRAAAAMRWNGSWHQVEVAIDPKGTGEPAPALLAEIEAGLFPFRRIGHDLLVRAARYVPVELALSVCVKPAYLRGHIKAALLETLSARALPGGRRGLFAPDSLTFGGSIYLSQITAAVQRIEGVESVTVTRLVRQGHKPDGELESGLLRIGPLEIARLDNDPNEPENGKLTLNLGGGR